jgi:hypothetical protein
MDTWVDVSETEHYAKAVNHISNQQRRKISHMSFTSQSQLPFALTNTN